MNASDEQAIRDGIQTWMAAMTRGDIDTILDLMTDDVVFITPGTEPFGKKAFAAGSEDMKKLGFSGSAEVLEMESFGDLAFVRLFIRTKMAMPGQSPARYVGHTLSIHRRCDDGKWRLARDANFVAPQKVKA